MTRVLLGLRDLAVGLGLALVVLFPLPGSLWQMASLLWPDLDRLWPVSSVFFQAWDGGGQQPMARALLRSLCAGVALAGLILPAPPRPDGSPWRRPPWAVWGLLFLALGVLSALQAPHRFQALREWETWLALGLLTTAVASQWRRSWGAPLLGLLYSMVVWTTAHALLLAIPGSWQRPGGFFHHPNAFSTYCLMMLAVTFSRSFQDGRDARLAQLLSGLLLGLALSAGSLTGAALLAGLALALAPFQVGLTGRVTAGGVAAATVLAANLRGGWAALMTLPGLLCLAWLVALLTRRLPQGKDGSGPDRCLAGATALIALSAAGLLAGSALLAPPQTLDKASASREDSARGRLQLYRVSLNMVAQHPLLGAGPGGFSREFPAAQTTVEVFSKFAHSLPLEIAAEWGLPALACLLLLTLGALREAFSEEPLAAERRICGWVLLVFTLHAGTDVQTQFPYLLALVALALGRLASREEPGKPPILPRTHRLAAAGRLALSMACLALLWLNLARVSAGLERAMATRLSARATSPATRQLVEGLLSSSFQADPLDSESARLLGLALLAEQKESAAEMAELAQWLDPQRASCRWLKLSARPPALADAVSEFQAAIATDRVNYPVFYRWLAEALWAQQQPAQALQLLRQQSDLYNPLRLAGLMEFREADLADQLVEFYGLKAFLEAATRAGGGEPDLRLALTYTGQNQARRQGLRSYLMSLSDALRVPLPAHLESLLDEFPAHHLPAPVEPPLHHPADL